MYPTLQGLYFFADFCSGLVGTIDNLGNVIDHGNIANSPVSFGRDWSGELYLVSISLGRVYKIFDDDLGIAEHNQTKLQLLSNPASHTAKILINNDMIQNLVYLV